MPRTYKCAFCGGAVQPGEGIVYVRNDGVILRFCSGKCYKNMLKLKRDPKRLKWTKVYAKTD